MDKLVVLKNQKVIRRINEGNPWIYSNELIDLPNFETGSIVKIIDGDNNNYGIGFYNRNSLIAVRMLLTDEINFDLVKNRIEQANNLRKKIINNSSCCRIVFGESDYLSGLIIDRYDCYFSIEILSAGFENLKDLVVKSLIELFPETRGIMQRNNSIWRLREGLPQNDEILFGDIPNQISIEENRINYLINISRGQKTGYFYDQRLNRNFLQSIAKGSNLLDLFCNQGGFALNAAKGGANRVVGVDIQPTAIQSARNNADYNRFSNVEFIEQDCFEFLKKNSEKYDIVVSDPPAFTKSKKNIPEAIGAYYQINKLAMRNLIKGGILLTSSCSHHIFEDKFYDIIQRAAHTSKRNLRLIYRGLQSPDHPILDALPETKYLKFFGFIVD